MKKKETLMTVLFMVIGGFFCRPAEAHFPWINLADYSPATGEALQLTIGWGHRYPLGGFLKKGDLQDIVILAADGTEESVVAASALEFQSESSLSRPGAYLVVAQRKSGFYTKTTAGGRRQSKKGLQNVIKCSKSHMCMKSIATVGEGKGRVDARVGHPLEIIPLANPADLKAGDYLPVQVLLHGQPCQDKIFATYMGFSTEKGVFAYTAKTDRMGMGRIRILQPGVWLVKAEHQEPYADQSECDVESYIATLTLEVK